MATACLEYSMCMCMPNLSEHFKGFIVIAQIILTRLIQKSKKGKKPDNYMIIKLACNQLNLAYICNHLFQEIRKIIQSHFFFNKIYFIETKTRNSSRRNKNVTSFNINYTTQNLIRVNPAIPCLSHDVISGSDITPRNKIDKPLVVYRSINVT